MCVPLLRCGEMCAVQTAAAQVPCAQTDACCTALLGHLPPRTALGASDYAGWRAAGPLRVRCGCVRSFCCNRGSRQTCCCCCGLCSNAVAASAVRQAGQTGRVARAGARASSHASRSCRHVRLIRTPADSPATESYMHPTGPRGQSRILVVTAATRAAALRYATVRGH